MSRDSFFTYLAKNPPIAFIPFRKRSKEGFPLKGKNGIQIAAVITVTVTISFFYDIPYSITFFTCHFSGLSRCCLSSAKMP